MEANRKRVQVHRLPTKDKSQIWGWRLGLAFMKTPSKPVKGAEGLPYHLYFTTDEEIKEGDWYLDVLKTGFPTVHKCGNSLPFTAPKIIATTDPELIGDKGGMFKTLTQELPQPSQAFIKAYCEQGGFDEVDVEYVEMITCKLCNKSEEECSDNFTCEGNMIGEDILKDPIHNTITTHRIVEKMYSREELKNLMMQSYFYGQFNKTDSFHKRESTIEKLIKENLKQ